MKELFYKLHYSRNGNQHVFENPKTGKAFVCINRRWRTLLKDLCIKGFSKFLTVPVFVFPNYHQISKFLSKFLTVPVFHFPQQNLKILVQSIRMMAVVLVNLLGEIGRCFLFSGFSSGYSGF
jgi:hypothetical protein